jgi:hypothetical protein
LFSIASAMSAENFRISADRCAFAFGSTFNSLIT